MVGNDIVDLDDMETMVTSLHRRFDARVFAPCESALVAAAAVPHRLRWALWAAKEAAYKVLRKRQRAGGFAPRRFVVRGLDVLAAVAEPGRPRRAHGTVRGGGVEVPVHVEAVDGAVQALAVDGVGPEAAGWEMRALVAGESPAVAVRELVLRGVGQLLAIEPHRLRVVREHRVPRVVHGGEPLPVDVSLSHHGRYVAGAWCLVGEGV